MQSRLLMTAVVGVLCLVFPRVPLRADDDLAKKIEAVIDGPDYKQAHWGILVVDAEGKLLYSREPDRLFAPASVTKLYSCATALATLGADYKFETPVYRTGTLKDGKLQGNLVLVASGDLTFGGRLDANGKVAFKDHDHTYANSSTSKSELTDTDPLGALKSLAKQVAAAGIKHVTGEVLIDDRLFDHAQGSGSGPDYLTPIIVNDNVVDAVVSPGEKPGDPAKILVRPETSFVQWESEITTVDEKQPPIVDIIGIDGRRFMLRGQMPVQGRPIARIYPLANPAAFARALFIEALRNEGVRVDASPLAAAKGPLPARDAYARLQRVALYTSPPLSEALKVTLKVSHNLYASTLPLLVAVKNKKRTLADGFRLQAKFLAESGVDVKTISFGSGAGGSRADMVTPRATVQLLQAMSKRPDWEVYKNCLPVLGVDGTLVEAAPKDSEAKGKVFAKTGTLVWDDLLNDRTLLGSKAMAGTMKTAKGKTIFLAMFVNDVPLPKDVDPSREGKQLGVLSEIIYRNAP